jgi:hypothetical protein
VDGSLGVDGMSATDMILRRHDGGVIFTVYRYIFNCNDTLEAELHAIRQGMALALQHTEAPVIFQSDSSEALLALSGEGLSRSAYGHLMAEIKFFMEGREFIPIKIKREQNRVADRLASYSQVESSTVVWLRSAPPCMEDLLPLDCNPIMME